LPRKDPSSIGLKAICTFSLHNQPLLDGYREDWNPAVELTSMPTPVSCTVRPTSSCRCSKLIENAVDFCSVSGTITVRLNRAATHYELAVSNDGPPIPPDMLSRLFESLFEHRLGIDDKPHFGLGLYIVRLIAEFHGGRAIAANRSTGAGAVFTVILPLI
jgi:light-regulated signal transduction histidine kinase (bacteriophytochrome)